MLELLTILERGLMNADQIYEEGRSIELVDFGDLVEDYKELIRIIMSKIEPSIKHKLRKGGVSIIHNTYTGYDSEYQNKDLKYNELLTVQLAVNTRIMLKIPMVKDYDFSKIDTLSGKMYKVSVNYDSTSIDYTHILSSINNLVNNIREMKYKNYDYSLNKIIKHLKDKQIPYNIQEERSSIQFSFDRTLIET